MKKQLILKRGLARLKALYYRLREQLQPSAISRGTDVPIIINNFNRLTTLQQLIRSLTQRNYRHIYIIDNNSTYPPLLEYYNACPYPVIRLSENVGFKALWKVKELRKRFCGDYYIYTDADVMLDDNCPTDVVDHLLELLKNRYPMAAKIGLSIRIDDLPDCYSHKQQVIRWEQRYYAHKAKNDDTLFRAPVDTTFALYRPRVGLSRSRAVEAYRTAAPYQIRHLPWYTDSNNLTKEEQYYISHCRRATSWSSQARS